MIIAGVASLQLMPFSECRIRLVKLASARKKTGVRNFFSLKLRPSPSFFIRDELRPRSRSLCVFIFGVAENRHPPTNSPPPSYPPPRQLVRPGLNWGVFAHRAPSNAINETTAVLIEIPECRWCAHRSAEQKQTPRRPPPR